MYAVLPYTLYIRVFYVNEVVYISRARVLILLSLGSHRRTSIFSVTTGEGCHTGSLSTPDMVPLDSFQGNVLLVTEEK
ncbi:hypothetical protein L1987_07880 [Smallanthus sonchifolius]|uniref:Uncharacterized protein n=1 Tax=Smallanthus sonchifolius TaxID=185202 RepID=A0ACB9JJ17_9ASTR|nr:hypothetical protein L1987_07880 [Smallanthus sonchifolius]